MKLEKRKTVLELMLLDGIPAWIIELWVQAHVPKLVAKMADGLGVGENHSHTIRKELIRSINNRRLDKTAIIVGSALLIIGGSLFWYPTLSTLGIFISIIGIAIMLAALAALRSDEDGIEMEFLHDFYNLIDTLKDTGDPTWDMLWVKLVDEPKQNFLYALHKRLEVFANQTAQGLLRLARSGAPSLGSMSRVTDNDRFNRAWDALLAFGFSEEDLGQNRDHYFAFVREMLRRERPDLFELHISVDKPCEVPLDERPIVDAGALAEGGG